MLHSYNTANSTETWNDKSKGEMQFYKSNSYYSSSNRPIFLYLPSLANIAESTKNVLNIYVEKFLYLR